MDLIKMTIVTTVTNSDGSLHHELTQVYPGIAKADLPVIQRGLAEFWLGLGQQAAAPLAAKAGKK